MRAIGSTLICLLVFAAPQINSADSRTFKWTDENGVIHYGDRVPPRYAKTRTEVLNRQGVTVDVLEAEKTQEQLLEEMRLRRLDDEKRAAEAARRAYDRALIDSYASVDEILQTRQRRLTAVDGQIIFTTQNINQLKTQVATREAEIKRLRERQIKKGVANQVIPEQLTMELQKTRRSLAEHQEILEHQYLDQARIRIKYAEDIERYKLLQGISDEAPESN